MKTNLTAQMKKLHYTLLLLVLTSILYSCKAQKSDVQEYVISTKKTYQTIDNFGASDAWTTQFIGKWPKDKTDQITNWLFSTQSDEQGNPLGIGLSLWRFNIGSGSSEQGRNSKINDPWRRSELLVNTDGTFNNEKQLGQRYFLKRAEELGVKQFLGFVNSPPVYLTINGLGTNLGRGGTFNMKPENYSNYSKFLANVIEGLAKYDGVQLSYLSPFNEPDGHWNWDGTGQEGTAATKYEIAAVTRNISKEFAKRKLGTQIVIPESSDYHCMYKQHHLTDLARSYQNQSYFNTDSVASYVGNLYGVPKMLAAHSYWTTTPLSELKESRIQMQKTLAQQNIKFWETEYCIMSNDQEIGAGGGRDLTMKTALYVARIIHHDLVYANASAWQWWMAVSKYDYKDGLVYVNVDDDNLDGTITDSKLMWTLGNFSRFIRPGAIRIDIAEKEMTNTIEENSATNPTELMLSAYKNEDKSIIVVAINYSNEAKTIQLKIDEPNLKSWIPYLTNDVQENNLNLQKKQLANNALLIPAKSVITFVSE